MPNFDNYFKANEILANRKQKTSFELEQRRQEVFNKIPEYQSLLLEINTAGSSYVLAKLSKDTEQANHYKTEMDNLEEKRVYLLTSNGFSLNYLDNIPYCNLCNDTGVVNGKTCKCLKTENTKQKQAYLTSLSPMPNTTFDEFDLKYYPSTKLSDSVTLNSHMNSILNYTKAYAEKFNKNSKGILMMGNAGLGKTHLACAIANECIQKGFSVMYASSQTLFDTLEKTKFSYDENLIDTICDCDLFILDDLGSEHRTSYTIASLYNIVNTRLIKNLPTIYTSNTTTQVDFNNKYTEKISSRILGSCDCITFFGNDIRLQKK